MVGENMLQMIFETLGGHTPEKQKAVTLATISPVTSRTVSEQISWMEI
jgi:hypothetical protein